MLSGSVGCKRRKETPKGVPSPHTAQPRSRPSSPQPEWDLCLSEQGDRGRSLGVSLPRLEGCPGSGGDWRNRNYEAFEELRTLTSSPDTRLHLTGETVGGGSEEGMLGRLIGPVYLS